MSAGTWHTPQPLTEERAPTVTVLSFDFILTFTVNIYSHSSVSIFEAGYPIAQGDLEHEMWPRIILTFESSSHHLLSAGVTDTYHHA